MRGLCLLVTLLLGPVALHSQQIIQLHWPTTHAAAAVELHGVAKEWLPLFRAGLKSLPESAVVALCLSQPQVIGLAVKDAQTLQSLTAERYAQMSQSPVFQAAPSALPYCFSETKPAEGLATVCLPASRNATTPCLVFLHGYGGSFLWNLHVLVEAFPNHLIICPAHGMSSADVSPGYVHEAIAATAKHVGFTLQRPTLMGLSAGGFGACKVYVKNPKSWHRVVCLAAHGRESALSKFVAGMSLRFMAGADESFVLDDTFQRGVQTARRQGADADSFLVSGCGHFFQLQKPQETIAVLRKWVGQ